MTRIHVDKKMAKRARKYEAYYAQRVLVEQLWSALSIVNGEMAEYYLEVELSRAEELLDELRSKLP